jgi:hypothetical protein
MFPLPPSLSGLNEERRLTITLAWFSPINPDTRKYRKANLSFDPPKNKAGVDRINAQWQHVKNGTVQHEVLEGSNVVTYQDGESLEIDIVCRQDAGSLDESVIYGLAVTLEVAEDIEIPNILIISGIRHICESLKNQIERIKGEVSARSGLPSGLEAYGLEAGS